jgi:hypothetical protein
MAPRIGFAAACLAVLLAAVPAGAGLPGGAGVALAVDGQWARALQWLDPRIVPEPNRAEQYFRAAAQLELGLRVPALGALRDLSDSGGAFSGPALELGIQALFDEGRHDEVVSWQATSRAERFQDANSLNYRVGQARLLVGERESAQLSLQRVMAGRWRPYALYSLAILQFEAEHLGPAADLLGEAVTAAESASAPEVAPALGDTLRVARGRVLYHLAVTTQDPEGRDRRRLAEMASEQFRQVAEGSLSYPDALRGIGWCALETGDSSLALASFATASEVDRAVWPEDLWAQGRVYQRLGYHGEAARLYRAAGEAAVGLAGEMESGVGDGVEVPLPEAARWQRRGERSAAATARREALEANFSWLNQALMARDRRLAAVAGVIEDREKRIAELKSELMRLSVKLRDFLDQIPAAALFPVGERARVGALIALQKRLDDDVTRIEGALGAISRTVFWSQATEGQQARGTALWTRLADAKVRLGELQLGFLLALKERVSQRELELAQQIERLEVALVALAGPVDAAHRERLAAVQRGEKLRARVAGLRDRSRELDGPLAALGAVASDQVRAAEAAARGERARTLRLQADAYALDEAQSLHLLQERPR